MHEKETSKITIPKEGEGALSIHGYYTAPESIRESFKTVIWESLLNYPKEILNQEEHKVPYPKQQLVISGSFLSLSGSMGEQFADLCWCRNKLLSLMEIGMDTLIIYTGSEHSAVYPSKLAASAFGEKDPLGTILEIGSELNFKIYVGVPFMSSYWMVLSEDELENLLALTNPRLKEMKERYSHHSAFAGWYIPYELCDAFVLNKPNLPDFVRRLSEVCQELMPGKDVMIAPYFRTTMEMDEFKALWTRILGEANIQILAMQDSVGVNGPYAEMRLKELGVYYSALHEVCQKVGVRLWTDLELFDQEHGAPLDYEQWSAKPAKGERIIAQVEAQSPYVEKIVCFDFFHHLDPQQGPEQAESFRVYYDWAVNVLNK